MSVGNFVAFEPSEKHGGQDLFSDFFIVEFFFFLQTMMQNVVTDNVSGLILDLSACGLGNCLPYGSKIMESLKIQITSFLFSSFRCLYYLFVSILQSCIVSTVRDKHIKRDSGEDFSLTSTRPAIDVTEQ